MARLICLTLSPGQLLEMSGIRYSVLEQPLDQRVVRLQQHGPVDKTIQMSKNELASLLVLEKATLIDVLDIPEPKPEPDVNVGEEMGIDGRDEGTSNLNTSPSKLNIVDISHMELTRVLDWHGKIYILKCLMHLGHSSPKSSSFKLATANALKDLEEWYDGIGLSGTSSWSAWTLYHDLLRWRQQRYKFIALQRKGVQYTPWVNRKSDFYVTAYKLAQEVGLEFPNLSTAKLLEKTNHKLSKQIGEYQGNKV